MTDGYIEQLLKESKAQRQRIIELEDLITRKFKLYDDLLCNLDDDNMGETLLREKDGMKTKIKITAEGLTSTVTATLGENVEPYTNDIEPFFPPEKADTDKIYYNNFNQTYYKWDGNTWVVEPHPPLGSMQSTIQQNAESISAEVSKTFAVREFSGGSVPSLYADKSVVWYNTESQRYYYWSDILGRWAETKSQTIGSHFKQIAAGFELRGDVLVKGDLITEGHITGVSLSTHKDVLVGKYLKVGYEQGGGFTGEGNVQFGSGATIKGENNGNNLAFYAAESIKFDCSNVHIRGNRILTTADLPALNQN